MTVCVENGCTERAGHLGWCKRHYDMNRQRAMKRGDWHPDRVDATRSREHLKKLMTTGLTRYQIAKQCGIAYSTLGRIASGERKRVEFRVERKILSVPPGAEPVLAKCMVDATGARRRIQALYAIGWPMGVLVKESGVNSSTMSELVAAKRNSLIKANRDAIYETYRRLQMTPGPSSRARALAKKRGWAVPLLWDEDKIDDPKARPSKYAYDRYQGGHKVVA